jgi:hypothetical protein
MAVFGFDFALVRAEYGIVFEEMRECLGIGDIIDPDKFQVFPPDSYAQNVPPDPPEPVDTDLDRHLKTLRNSRYFRVT